MALTLSSTGATVVTLDAPAPASARTLTLPDPGANAYLYTVRGTVSGVGSATALDTLLLKKTSIADATATDVITVTVPNGNHAAAIRLTLLATLGGSDAFETTRGATGLVVLARTTGANVVAGSTALVHLVQAKVSGAPDMTSITQDTGTVSGAAGATNTFTIRVTITRASGTSSDHQCVVLAELINAEGSGVTMAAA